MINLVAWLRTFVGRYFPSAAQTATASTDKMDSSVNLWYQLYRDHPPWEDDCHGQTLNLAAAISAEFARLITIEMKSEITGSARADWLNQQYQALLRVLRPQLEYGCALGGVVFKPYVQGGRIVPDCVPQGQFYPYAFDNERMTGAIFFDQYRQGGYIYTRLEQHQYSNGTHTIDSKAFVSRNEHTLGHDIALSDVPRWASIDPHIEINGVDRPLYGYFRVPLANQVDIRSPLGVSVFSRAIKNIKEADLQWARTLWEYEGGELAIDAAEDVLRLSSAANGQRAYNLPKHQRRLFRRLNVANGISDPSFYKVFNPTLRDGSLLNGLDAIKREIEFKCCLAYGTLSNPQSVDKTAEEIRASKQRSYATVCDLQTSAGTAIDDYIYAMDALATACRLAPAGKYELQHKWGDGVLEDAEKEQAIRLSEVTAGLSKKEEYLMWRYGITEKKAREMLPDASAEKPPPFFDDGR